MWHSLIKQIAPEDLGRWNWWFGVLAIILPLLGGICGWIRFEMNDAVNKNKEAEMQRRIDQLGASANQTNRNQPF